MKGSPHVKYGSPKESLEYREDIPVPKIKSAAEVLIQIKAAGVNPVEAKVAADTMKLFNVDSLPSIIGADFAGIVVAKGNKVNEFKSVMKSLTLKFFLPWLTEAMLNTL